MYKCSVCGKGVLVEGLEKPIRACNCIQEIVVDGKTITKSSAIIADMEGTAYGKSQFNQK
jgi:hypothetical protein